MTGYIQDDYRLQAVERTGYPDGGPVSVGRCPICDSELYGSDTVYLADGEIVACVYCLQSKYAEDVMCDG